MLLKTSTLHAPWTVVEGEDKLWARIRVLQTVVDTVGAARSPRRPDKKKRKKRKS